MVREVRAGGMSHQIWVVFERKKRWGGLRRSTQKEGENEGFEMGKTLEK